MAFSLLDLAGAPFASLPSPCEAPSPAAAPAHVPFGSGCDPALAGATSIDEADASAFGSLTLHSAGSSCRRCYSGSGSPATSAVQVQRAISGASLDDKKRARARSSLVHLSAGTMN